MNKYGRVNVNFAPAVSRDTLKAIRQTIRGWHLQLKCDKTLRNCPRCSTRYFEDGKAIMVDTTARLWH